MRIGSVLLGLGLALAITWAGCSAGDDEGPSVDPTSRSSPSAPGARPAAGRERSLRVTLRVLAPDVARAAEEARAAAERLDGWVEVGEVAEDHARLELRIPVTSVADARASLGALGRTIASSEEVEDVTLAHADLDARIASAEAEESRLAAMFADRTASLADVLAVEHELARVRGEIETAQAEERALRDRVAMARISVDLARDVPAFTSDPIGVVARAGETGAHTAAVLALALVAALAAVAPTALLVLAAAWVGRRGWRALGAAARPA